MLARSRFPDMSEERNPQQKSTADQNEPPFREKQPSEEKEAGRQQDKPAEEVFEPGVEG